MGSNFLLCQLHQHLTRLKVLQTGPISANRCSGFPTSTPRTMRLKLCLTISRATKRLRASASFPTQQSELRVSRITRAHRLDAPYYSFRAAASRADKQRPVFKSWGRLGSSLEFVIDNGEATNFPAVAHFIYRENGEPFQEINKSLRERTPVLPPSTPSLVHAEALAESDALIFGSIAVDAQQKRMLTRC